MGSCNGSMVWDRDHRLGGNESRRGGHGSHPSFTPLMRAGESELSQGLDDQDHQTWLELKGGRGRKSEFGEDAMELDSARKCEQWPPQDAHVHTYKAVCVAMSSHEW